MKKYLIAIFFLTLFVYSLNLSRQSSGDTLPTRLLPFNILEGRGIYLDNYASRLPKDVYFFQKYNDHVISAYPLIPGLLSIPIYLPFYVYAILSNSDSINNLYFLSFDAERWSASIFTSLNVLIFFIFIRQISKNNKLSLTFSLIFAFATQNFSINSQHLWQHGFAGLFMLLSQVFLFQGFLLKDNDKLKKRNFLFALIFGLLSCYARLGFFFYLLLTAIFIGLYDRKKLILYGAILIVGCLSLEVYNYYFYHSLIGGNNYQIGGFALNNLLPNLLGSLFSPSRGMFFYTPLFIFSFFPILMRKQFNSQTSQIKALIYLNTLFLASIILYSSAWGEWFGGLAFGNRYLADAAPSAMILLYIFYKFISGRITNNNFIRKVITTGAFILIGYSIFIQLVGVFYFPRGHWDEYPEDVGVKTSRFWDFQDNLIFRNLAIGPSTELINQIYYRLNGIESKDYPGGENCSLRKVSDGNILGFNTIKVAIRNNSDVDWITGGFNSLFLGQIYASNTKIETESPIPSTSLPPVIKSGDEALADLVILPPSGQSQNIIIAPKQDHVGWWIGKCSLVIRIPE